MYEPNKKKVNAFSLHLPIHIYEYSDSFLAQVPMDTTTRASSAVQATEFSRMISVLGPLGFDSHSVGTLSNDISEHSDVGQTVLKSHKDKSDNGVKYNNASALTPTRKNISACRENEEGCQCSRSSNSITLPEAEASFCYGCRLIVREMVCISRFEISRLLDCLYCSENIMIYRRWDSLM
jgi:hypothetical protein